MAISFLSVCPGLRRRDMTRARKDVRHRARETALQILYQWEIGKGDVGRAAETFFTLQWPDSSPPDALRDFASALARDTVARLEAIDPLIAETAGPKGPRALDSLDRLILRKGQRELVWFFFSATRRRRTPWSSTRRSSSRGRSAPRSR